jgi:outer membrane protein assembly factor BamD (BamD/ComL family)
VFGLEGELASVVRLFLTEQTKDAKTALDKFLRFNPANIAAQYLNFWICYSLRENKPKVVLSFNNIHHIHNNFLYCC